MWRFLKFLDFILGGDEPVKLANSFGESEFGPFDFLDRHEAKEFEGTELALFEPGLSPISDDSKK